MTPARFFWGIMTLVFCYLGAVLPIWRFAQPINFVSFWIIALAMVVGALGIFVGHPNFTTDALRTWDIAAPGSGAINYLWPMMFVTIACGAVSGWHSLISSSGTARQLENEKDALPVAGGSMMAEMVLAVIALIAGAATFANTQGYLDAMAKSGPTGVFAGGMSVLMNYVGLPTDAGVAFGGSVIIILALTVMQLVIRFMRMFTAELVGDRAPIFKNFHVATVIALLFTLFLLATGSFNLLWQLFGGSNQLMAGLALMLVVIYLRAEGKPSAFVFWPMVFMLITTTVALLVTAYNLLWANVLLKMTTGKPVDPGLAAGNIIMGIIALFLVVAAVILVWDGWKAINGQQAQGPATAAAQA